MIGRSALCAAILTMGCTQAPDEAAYVLLGPETLARGGSLMVDEEVFVSTLPIAVDPAADVMVVLDVEQPLTLSAGEIVQVDPDGLLRSRLGEDVSADGLVLWGSAEAIDTLDDAIGPLTVSALPGRFEVAAPDLVALSATVEPLDDIHEVGLMLPAEATMLLESAGDEVGVAPVGNVGSACQMGEVVRSSPGAMVDGSAGGASGVTEAFAIPNLHVLDVGPNSELSPSWYVGVYHFSQMDLVLDAAGGYRIENALSEEPARGRFDVVEGGVRLSRDDGLETVLPSANDGLVLGVWMRVLTR